MPSGCPTHQFLDSDVESLGTLTQTLIALCLIALLWILAASERFHPNLLSGVDLPRALCNKTQNSYWWNAFFVKHLPLDLPKSEAHTEAIASSEIFYYCCCYLAVLSPSAWRQPWFRLRIILLDLLELPRQRRHYGKTILKRGKPNLAQILSCLLHHRRLQR